MVSMVFRGYGIPMNAYIVILIAAKHSKCNTI